MAASYTESATTPPEIIPVVVQKEEEASARIWGDFNAFLESKFAGLPSHQASFYGRARYAFFAPPPLDKNSVFKAASWMDYMLQASPYVGAVTELAIDATPFHPSPTPASVTWTAAANQMPTLYGIRCNLGVTVRGDNLLLAKKKAAFADAFGNFNSQRILDMNDIASRLNKVLQADNTSFLRKYRKNFGSEVVSVGFCSGVVFWLAENCILSELKSGPVCLAHYTLAPDICATAAGRGVYNRAITAFCDEFNRVCLGARYEKEQNSAVNLKLRSLLEGSDVASYEEGMAFLKQLVDK